MSVKSKFVLPVVAYFALLPMALHATPNTAAADANSIELRASCFEGGQEITNCFDNLPLLLDWTWNTRNPSASDPLVVNIGSGLFYAKPGVNQTSGTFCNNNGFVTFRGAGREHTKISAPPNSVAFGITIRNCQSLEFQDLTISGGPALYGLFWSGDGNSTYSNVAIEANGYAWYDADCSANNHSKHYFFNSIITAKSHIGGNATAYLSRCAATWFYGSEITAIGTVNNATVWGILADTGEIHVYGSSIRALSDPGITTNELIAVLAQNSPSEVHIHGTGIDSISLTNSDVTAIKATNGAIIHASESSYVLKSNGGNRSRIVNTGGDVQAPYLWQSDNLPSIISQHGSDLAIINSGDTNGQPHMLIYSDQCASKWFDSTSATCK